MPEKSTQQYCQLPIQSTHSPHQPDLDSLWLTRIDFISYINFLNVFLSPFLPLWQTQRPG
jgi:hypothetical protein